MNKFTSYPLYFSVCCRHRLGVSPRGPIVVCVLWTLVLMLNVVSVRSVARIIREGDPAHSTYIYYYADIISLCTQCLYLFTLIPGRSGTHAAYNRMIYREQHQGAVQVQFECYSLALSLYGSKLCNDPSRFFFFFL